MNIEIKSNFFIVIFHSSWKGAMITDLMWLQKTFFKEFIGSDHKSRKYLNYDPLSQTLPALPHVADVLQSQDR